ncbi:MAG: two-component system, NarL family, nitrate/nitrite response regulator NarL [Gaiellales bacterium]|nr:two-component system, NarL family, nitrate/nitrite response regulator NarL [Gaiellales bacterium]
MPGAGRGTAARSVRVLIADDHPLYRQGAAGLIASCPELDLVGEAGSGQEAVDAIRALTPDVAVVDLGLPDFDGITVLGMLEREGSPTRVVIVSASEDGATIHRAFAHGARAWVPKVAAAGVLCETLLTVARGESVILPSIQSALTRELRARRERTDEPLLTARELEILRMCADGLSSPEIAAALFVSLPTVKTHLQHVYTKLEVSDRAAAVAQAMRRGMLT